ncbi:MAG: Eco57I restriction-modification methylase domain-containing protein, partial [Blastocatellia bacterium]
MNTANLVNKLREQKSALKFADATVENVWADFLLPTLKLLGWDDPKPLGLNTIDPSVDLGGRVRVGITAGKARATRTRARAESYLELDPDVNISVVTNFDEWEILFRDWSKGPIAEFRAEEFVSSDGVESPAWDTLNRLIGRRAIESGSYLHLANQLHQQRVDEAEINVYVQQLNNLRRIIGDYLIANPKELSTSKRNKSKRSAYQIMGITLGREDRDRDEATLNQLIQRLIDRFLIFRFAEDNEILVEGKPKPLSDVYYNLLLGKPLDALALQDTAWRLIAGSRDSAMTGLFGEFASTYNGGVFEPLDGNHPDRINQLPLNDKLVLDIVDQIVKRPVKKKLARLLGYIYEKYIGQRLYIVAEPSDIDRVALAAELQTSQTKELRARLKQDGGPLLYLGKTPDKKKQAIYYTPDDVTRYIAGKTVGVLLEGLYEKLERTEALTGDDAAGSLLEIFTEAQELSVLDPTCGSGAFLIEALGLLRQFYRKLGKTLAARMSINYLDEADGEIRRRAKGTNQVELGEALVRLKSPGVFALNWNIFGVDLDPRAVEICSVSLMIQVIDELVRPRTGEVVRFPSIMGENIKRGNSLVSPIRASGQNVSWQILTPKVKGRLTRIAELRSTLRDVVAETERERIRVQIDELAQSAYATLPDSLPDKWKPQAFCWLVEFPEIFARAGGFAAVIGNPPYLQVGSTEYAGLNLKTLASRDLYVYIIEVGTALVRPNGRLGMIVKLGLVATDRMRTAREFLIAESSEIHVSTYERRPQHLIQDADIRHAIVVLSRKAAPADQFRYCSTRLVKWFASQRDGLLDRLSHVDATEFCSPRGFPKVGSEVELSILRKIYRQRKLVSDYEEAQSANCLYFHRNVQYWMKVLDHHSHYRRLENDKPEKSPESKPICFSSGQERDVFVALLNSNLFYWFQTLYSEMRHVPRSIVSRLPFDYATVSKDQRKRLATLSKKLMADFKAHSFRRVVNIARVGRLEYDEYYPAKSRHIIDEIDAELAQHYHLSPVELSFLQTYDLEFRMSAAANDGEDE